MGTEVAETQPTDPPGRVITVLLSLGCLLTVAPLLAWVYDLGAFRTWFLACSLPALTAVCAVLAWWSHTGRHLETLAAVRAGIIGGLLGTLAYDLVRVPLVALGYQVLAPIDSYGVLLLGAPASSPLSGFAGWAYHFSNGIFFAVAFALVAARRPMAFAVFYALLLETGAAFSAFAGVYNIRGKWDLLAIAYLAHVPYGLAIGWMTTRPERRMESWTRALGRPITWSLAGLVLALVLWHRPFAWATDSSVRVVDSRFVPLWSRIAPGGCTDITNTDDEELAADNGPTVAPGQTAALCPSRTGVHRVKLNKLPRSGGFVIVDPALAEEAGS